MAFPRLLNRLNAEPGFRTETLALAASLLFTLLANGSFWSALLDQRDALSPTTWRLTLFTGLALTGAHWFLLLLVINRWIAKPLLVALWLLTAAAVYFMSSYGVYLDKAMIRNVMETDLREASELLDWKLLLALVGYGAMPAWLFWRARIRPAGLRQTASLRAACLLAALAMVGGGVWAASDLLVPMLREQKTMRYLVTPSNLVISGASALTAVPANAGPAEREVIAPDAHRAASAAARRPRVVVLVVGETVRASNWGLNGYARDTTPALATRQVVNFREVSACGTDTATSVPCMFSLYGRERYDEKRIRASESVLHVLKRAGVDVLWRDNQSGCKGVCDGLPTENLSRARVPGLCNDQRCFDEILLEGLADRIETTRGDLLIVLHTLGNHGPAYYQRYPASYRRWTPTCDTTDLASCSQEALVNTYDNAIAYTDHVLAKLIDTLGRIRTHDTAMIYVSDHGESLGEKNLYLHGMPYAIAPAEQTRVPMTMWFSPRFRAARQLEPGCLAGRAATPVSHDYLFHTLLGLLDVETGAYRPDRDLMAGCRRTVAAR